MRENGKVPEQSRARLERSPEKLQQVYDIGRRDALMKMRDLKRWLENH